MSSNFSYAKLDHSIEALIRCPFCKGAVTRVGDDGSGRVCPRFDCADCGGQYRRLQSGIYDFTPAYPSFLQHQPVWESGQADYERCSQQLSETDSYESYSREIDSVKEIYASEFALSGVILDVGGGQGRLRHFLSRGVQFISIDPFADAFRDLEKQINLVRAYPCLLEPCNFLKGRAEYLPFSARSFDWVHMRSVIDHFDDPYLAMCEARRVLRLGGSLLLGVSVSGGCSPIKDAEGASFLVSRALKKLRDDGLAATFAAAARRLTGRTEKDHHVWHPTFPQLMELLKSARFEIGKVHWQKRPYDQCVYVRASKPAVDLTRGDPSNFPTSIRTR
jgi:ubiquinone/menaquinone biosynthesis C-methylase UbiE